MKSKFLFLLATSVTLIGSAALAQDTPFVGQVIFTAAKTCPTDFVPADGRTLSMEDYQLYIAVTGKTSVPDLRGRAIVAAGNYVNTTAPRDVQVGPIPSNGSVQVGSQYALFSTKTNLLACVATYGQYPPRP